MKKMLIIAIDGTAGAGKSTLAKSLARKLGYLYLDTGAMYRAVTYKALKCKIDIGKESKLSGIAQNAEIRLTKTGKVYLDGKNATKKIRMPEVSSMVSKVSAIRGVRQKMVKRQREIGRKGGVIVEGRDIGTVVFPKADIKFFLVAELKERAQRRYKELLQKKISANIKQVQENIVDRDIQDSSRKQSPLKPAKDAIIIDTSDLCIRKKNLLVLKYIQNKVKSLK